MSERIIEFRDALREAMCQEMRRDKKVLLLGEEVAANNEHAPQRFVQD